MTTDVRNFLRDDLSSVSVDSDDFAAFLATYRHLFEHSPWVVERAWDLRPFASAAALHDAFWQVIDQASDAERLSLVRAHPELASKDALNRGLTASSRAEQASAGLDRLTDAEYEEFSALNAAYRNRFGFPFVICVRLHDKNSIVGELKSRLAGEPRAELVAAISQVGLISKLRLAQLNGAGSR